MDIIKSLYNAAVEGDSKCLISLLQQDPFILDRCQVPENSFPSSPLHVSAKLGHLEFSIELLNRNPGLAEELDSITKSCPLHLASAKGHLEIVKALMAVSPKMCLSRDFQGRNPLHLAALNGRLNVLEELSQEMPLAVREKVGDNAGSVLHLCVKFGKLDALKVLVNGVCDDETLNAKDSDGNSILHLAVAGKQLEVIQFLLTCENLKKNALNGNDMTAMDISAKGPKEANKDREIWKTLRKARLHRAADMPDNWGKRNTWLENRSNTIAVVASLIATIAYQSGMNPPGGVWQDSQSSDSAEPAHYVGQSVWATTLVTDYYWFMLMNAISVASSIFLILLLISGLPFRRLATWVMVFFLAVALYAMTLSYLLSLHMLTPEGNDHARSTISTLIKAFVSMMVLHFLVIIIVGIVVLFKSARKFSQSIRDCSLNNIACFDA